MNARNAVLLLVCLIWVVQAQSPVSSYPADHHEVYASFLQYQTSWQQWAAGQAAANSPKAAQLANDFATLVRIDPKEIGELSSAAGKTGGDLAALDGQRNAYLNANKANPSAHTLSQFAVRRQQIIMSGVTALMRDLTPRSWVGLHTYINWDYRVNGKTIGLGGK